MINTLNYDETKSLLVLVNLEFLVQLKLNGTSFENIYYSTGCKYKKQVAIKLGVNPNNRFKSKKK